MQFNALGRRGFLRLERGRSPPVRTRRQGLVGWLALLEARPESTSAVFSIAEGADPSPFLSGGLMDLSGLCRGRCMRATRPLSLWYCAPDHTTVLPKIPCTTKKGHIAV
eukprot:scaffold2248_cov133-Isochrysis_galbana.AAC.3